MIAIIGAGAMGGMLAARLTAAGKEAVLIDVSEPLVEQVSKHGLTVETKNGKPETFRVRIASSAEGLGQAEAVFFFVKAQHTAAAARTAAPLVGPATIVASLQNGWGNADTLAGTYDERRIVVGVTYHSATVLGPGRVGHTGFGATFVGPYADDADPALARKIADILESAGIETEVSAKVKTEIWKKLILNSVTLPSSALTGLCSSDQAEEGPLLELLDDIARESTAVARALGHEIDAEERIERIHAVMRNAGSGKSSMLQDAEARRKTEIEVINGAVVRAAESAGVPAPLNKAMFALVGGLERGWKR